MSSITNSTTVHALLGGGWKFRVPTICARTVAEGNFLSMSNWISRIRNSLPEYAGCKPWSGRRHRSMTVANKWKPWQAWRWPRNSPRISGGRKSAGNVILIAKQG